MEIIDLDILRPKNKGIKLGGKQIDISYIPCGITFEVDRIIRELGKLKIEDIQKDINISRKAFDLTVELCSIFISCQYPEMDEKWLRKNSSPQQLKIFAELIKESLVESLKGIESKNQEATNTTNGTSS